MWPNKSDPKKCDPKKCVTAKMWACDVTHKLWTTNWYSQNMIHWISSRCDPYNVTQTMWPEYYHESVTHVIHTKFTDPYNITNSKLFEFFADGSWPTKSILCCDPRSFGPDSGRLLADDMGTRLCGHCHAKSLTRQWLPTLYEILARRGIRAISYFWSTSCQWTCMVWGLPCKISLSQKHKNW